MSVLKPLEHRAFKLSERYRALSLRERVLVGLSVLALTWLIWYLTLAGFLDSTKLRVEQGLLALESQVSAEVARQSVLQAAQSNDPNVRLERERARLNSELSELNNSLSSVLEHFVAPEKMPELLRDVIQHHEGLRLKRMVSLPVEPVELKTPAQMEEGESQQERPPAIYRHPLRLEFEGDYFAVLAYLADLESSGWKFGWRNVRYLVEDYPVAVVTLEIETLSREKSWIGV